VNGDSSAQKVSQKPEKRGCPERDPLEGRSGQGRSREPSGKGARSKPYVISLHAHHATTHHKDMEGFREIICVRALAALYHAVQDPVYLREHIRGELDPGGLGVVIDLLGPGGTDDRAAHVLLA
jgi:hypothetical protein